MAENVMKRTERGEGELQAIDLHRLLIGVPDEAVIEIYQDDPDDYRNGGTVRWHFEARWHA